MAKNTIILHLDWKVFLDVLPDAELGQWTRAIMHYMETGEPPEGMSKAVEVAFYASFERIGRDLANWENTRAVKSESGRKGGIRSGEVRRAKAEEEKNEATKQNEAERSKPKLPVSCNLYPVPVPVSSSSEEDRDSASGATTMTTLIEEYEGAYGTATPVIRRSLGSYVESLGPELVSKVIDVTAQAGGQKWPYLAKSLEECKRKGMDLAAYEAEQIRRKGGCNARVDRPTPSGNDWRVGKYIPMSERRLKRED